MKKEVAVLIVLAWACFAYGDRTHAQANGSSQSQTQSGVDQDIQLLRKDIRSEKKQLIAANLKLTADQDTKFWPVTAAQILARFESVFGYARRHPNPVGLILI